MPEEKKTGNKFATTDDLLATAAERVSLAGARHRKAQAAMAEYEKRHDALDKECAEAKYEMGQAKQQMIDAVDACAAGQ